MADALTPDGRRATGRRPWLGVIARQRELSLVAIMLVLGALVSLAAPQFLTVDNLSQVAVLASIIAVAAIGEALVVITRNIDLSVEATIGLVAYCVAGHPRAPRPRRARRRSSSGIGLGLVLGMINGVDRHASSGCRRSSRRSAR